MDESLEQLFFIVLLLLLFFNRGKNENELESKERPPEPINGWQIYSKKSMQRRSQHGAIVSSPWSRGTQPCEKQ